MRPALHAFEFIDVGTGTAFCRRTRSETANPAFFDDVRDSGRMRREGFSAVSKFSPKRVLESSDCMKTRDNSETSLNCWETNVLDQNVARHQQLEKRVRGVQIPPPQPPLPTAAG